MTKKNLVVGAIIAAVVFGVSCSDDFPSLSTKAPTKLLFTANLTPDQEKPTAATGVSSKGTSDVTVLDTNLIRVETRVSTIDSVTQSHIHAGDANTACPIMVFLVANVAAGRAPVTGTDVTLSVVDINRATTFLSPFTFDSLMFRIKNGTAYTNVHTRKYPGGEIRGQIVPK
jgi:hypothetical protein